MCTKRAFSVVFIFIFLFACTGCDGLYVNADHTSALRINEVVSSNTRSLVDEALGTPDWIELYNASASPIDLTGYGLTDNPKAPHKWTFPSVTIPAGGYLIVYATKADGALCTGFGLSRGGDSLCLSDKYYTLLDYVEIPHLKATYPLPVGKTVLLAIVLLLHPVRKMLRRSCWIQLCSHLTAAAAGSPSRR